MPRKKIGLLTVILLMVFPGWAEDRYPAENESPEVIQLLLEAGYDIRDNPNYITYSNPWEELIKLGAPLSFFEKLLVLGKSVESGNGLYESPLVQAIQSNNYEVVDFLIRKGANVNREHRFKRTPLHYAATAEDPRILKRLIEAGANVNQSDESGFTPLHSVFTIQSSLSNSSKKIESIQFLLSHNANINAKTDDGLTPLMLAVISILAEPRIVQALLQGKPDINAVNAKGQSALIIAAGNVRNPEIITLLLNAGANAKIEDNTGRTALDWFDMNRRINQSPVRKELKDRM